MNVRAARAKMGQTAHTLPWQVVSDTTRTRAHATLAMRVECADMRSSRPTVLHAQWRKGATAFFHGRLRRREATAVFCGRKPAGRYHFLQRKEAIAFFREARLGKYDFVVVECTPSIDHDRVAAATEDGNPPCSSH